MLSCRSIEASESFLVLVLFLGNSLLSLQQSFSALVELKGGDQALRGVDGDLNLGSYLRS